MNSLKYLHVEIQIYSRNCNNDKYDERVITRFRFSILST